MGVLDDLLGGALHDLWTPARRDKGLERLAAEGELVPATIYAIKVKRRSEDADVWHYGLDLIARGGPLRARHLDGRVAIDWPAAGEAAAGLAVRT
jgi:hypothetical protein